MLSWKSVRLQNTQIMHAICRPPAVFSKSQIASLGVHSAAAAINPVRDWWRVRRSNQTVTEQNVKTVCGHSDMSAGSRLSPTRTAIRTATWALTDRWILLSSQLRPESDIKHFLSPSDLGTVIHNGPRNKTASRLFCQPVHFRISRILLLVSKSLHSLAPTYMSELLTPYTTSPLRSPPL